MKKTVAIIYDHIPHYRVPVFGELAQNSDLRYAFYSGLATGGDTSAVAGEGINFKRLRNHSVGPWLWQSGLIRCLVEDRPSIAIFLGDVHYISTWAAAAVCRMLAIPVFFWTHGWRTDETGVRRHIRLSYYRLANTLLLYGDRAKRIGARLGYPRDRMTIIYNSLREHPTAQCHRTTRLGAGAPTEVIKLVLCSRLIPSRRVDLLLRAMAGLRDDGVKAQLRVIGDGEERRRLEALAFYLSVDASFGGAIYDPQQLAEEYARADLCVIPGAAGLAVIQSLLAGVPVITHSNHADNGPEVEAIAPGITGDFFRQGDASDLARTIMRWVSRKDTDEERRERSMAYQAVALRYSPRAQADRIHSACVEELARLRRPNLRATAPSKASVPDSSVDR